MILLKGYPVQPLSGLYSKMIPLQSFHMAGDGKLGGLVDPNDGLCHLNSSGFYEWSTVQGEL